MKTQRINKSSLINTISEQTGLSIKIVGIILTALFDVIKKAVSDNCRIVLRGFGSFSRKTRKWRRCRDIRTGQVRIIPETNIPSFQASRVLIREINPIAKTVTKPKEQHQEETTVDIVISKPNPSQTDDLKIGYSPCHEFDSTENYPVVYTPKANSYLKLPREGRSNIRGYKEPEFFQILRESLSDINVSDNFHLKIPGRPNPYEPDIVLYDESCNLFIDVEIDEPYDGYSRLVTHTLEGNDSIRNVFFKESGWVVVRFSEIQVHLKSEQCVDFLRNIISSMRGGEYSIFEIVETEPRWTRKKAIAWEMENYREKYLGVQFFQRIIRTRKILCTDGFEGIDSAIERTPVYPSQRREKEERTGSEQISTRNNHNVKPLSITHPPVLAFDEESHSYHVPEDNTGNTDHISVTTLIDRFFPSFDEEAYIQKRMQETGMSEADIKRELAEPSERGTEMHKQIERFLLDPSYDASSKEFRLFKQFYEREIIGRNLEFDSAEYEIGLRDTNIAGTVDALFRKPNGDYVMVDWKRSKHLIIDGYPKKYGFGRGLSVLSHLDNSSYYKYELQQSFYKYILEKDYGIRVSSMILAVLYPDYDRYYSIRLSEYRKQEVLDMIDAYEQTQ